jgi:hypothetical protein
LEELISYLRARIGSYAESLLTEMINADQ